jgi:hypothetical protein
MKKSKLVKLSAVMIALMSCYDINAEAVEKNGALLSASAKTLAIQPGIGYSSDMEGIASTICFAPLKVIEGVQQHSEFSWTQSQSVEKITSDLELTAELSGKKGIFSANSTLNYLNSLKENDLSLSVNYYQLISADTIMYYTYDPENILTPEGKKLYNNGNNPMFRSLCGDTLISSYNIGALLILSLQIDFYDQESKQTFKSKVGASVGDFINASSTISKEMTKYGLRGMIKVRGYQLGGDPSQLGKALRISATQCDVNNIAACQETVIGLAEYASKEFPTQFQKDDTGRIWLSPLVQLGGYTKDYSLNDLKMAMPPTYVIPEVQEARNALISAKESNQYYFDHLDSLISHYVSDPYTRATMADSYKDQLIALRNTAQKNLTTIQSGVGDGGAIECYNHPDKCVAISKGILSKLKLIDSKMVSNLLESIKYNLVMQGSAHDDWTGCTSIEAYFWPNGAQGYFLHYPFQVNPWNYMHMTSVSMVYNSSEVNINGNFHFTKAPSDGGNISYHGVNDGSDNYTGTLSYNGKLGKVGLRGNLNCQLVKTLNPYYFEPYHSV